MFLDNCGQLDIGGGDGGGGDGGGGEGGGGDGDSYVEKMRTSARFKVRLVPGRTMVTYQPTIWLQSNENGPTVAGASTVQWASGRPL